MEEKILALVVEWLENKDNLAAIKDLVVPLEPKKPIISTISEFETYKQQYRTYSNAVYHTTTRKEELESRQKKLTREICEALPGKNTWFVLNTIDVVVGQETNDWPMDEGDLHIIKNPVISELKELKFRHIKG